MLGGVFGSPIVHGNSTSTSSYGATARVKSHQQHAPVVGLTPRMKLLIGAGFCGSFTTFSTFSVDVVHMIGRGEVLKATSYFMANNAGGILAAAAGITLAKKIYRL